MFLMSCGLKITEEVDENVLIGTWTLDSISCGSTFSTTTEKERFIVTGTSTVTLTIEGNKITYASSGACTTSSTALYSTNFNGSSTGVLDITDVLTGGTTCSESLTDTGQNSVGTLSVPTTMDGTFSKSLNWLVTNGRDIFELKYYANFNGSGVSVSCNDECICKGIFKK